jgi:two-component system LytT family sensor kinase
MPDWLSIHEPILTNTIGHGAGAVLFGILLYLFLVNWRRARQGRSSLPALAAALAMLWNVGSLIGLATGPASGIVADVIVAASFSVLSFLPAVLLHIHLESHHRALWLSGYSLSVIAAVLHVTDLVTGAPRFHYAALLLVTLGFVGLTALSVFLEMRERNRRAASRLAGAMGLFLLAISFAHFSSKHPSHAWSGEVALHHAGLPLAIFVLLQDYRFLLLDAFLRFVLNASLAAAALLISIRAVQSPELVGHIKHPFDAGLLFIVACLLLTAFFYVRNRMQGLVTRVIFLRSNIEGPLQELRHLARATGNETEYLHNAADVVARFLHSARSSLSWECPLKTGAPAIPLAVFEPGNSALPSWVQSVVPLRLSRGDIQYLLLGPRDGGRRYLSEDLGVLARLGAVMVEHVEQLRSTQMQSLVSQAELKALQAQINPHFLFNSLNTLYGTIDRNNADARRLVLNLSDVFRYFLQSERPFIEVEEELKIIRAYLEIEELRLGPKLRTEMEIDPAALHVTIPVLSIQPLVENAVKHGIATRTGAGFVRLMIRKESDTISVSISNSGACDARRMIGSNGGIGLANVRRRLALCYGEEARLEVNVANDITCIRFVLPLKHLPEVSTTV